MKKSILTAASLILAVASLGMTGCSSKQGGADETTAVTTASTTAETTAETTEATTAAETEPVFEAVSDEEAERLHAYMHIFAQYYNSPYKQGDEIKSRAPVYLGALYLLRHADEYDFVQLIKGDSYTVSGENMIFRSKNILMKGQIFIMMRIPIRSPLFSAPIIGAGVSSISIMTAK